MSDSPWLRDLRRRAPEGRLRDSRDDLFATETSYFTRAFAERGWYYLVGLANGHVWRCSGMRLTDSDGDLLRLEQPVLLHPEFDANPLAGVDVLVSDVAWVADSEKPF